MHYSIPLKNIASNIYLDLLQYLLIIIQMTDPSKQSQIETQTQMKNQQQIDSSLGNVNEVQKNEKAIETQFQKWRCFKKLTLIHICLAIAVLVALSAGGVIYSNLQMHVSFLYDNTNFDYFYHCPALGAFKKFSQDPSQLEFKNQLQNFIKKYETQLNKTYYVAAAAGQAIIKGANNFTAMKVRYCGFARRQNQTCESAKFICSSPGPAFDVNENEEIIVHWINSYKPLTDKAPMDLVQGFSVNKCFNENQTTGGELCNKTAKIKTRRDLWMFDPTDHFPQDISMCQYENVTKKVLSSRNSFPLSPHVHGLEVEPYYDGNPMSWFDNNGEVGVGYNPDIQKRQKIVKEPTFKKIFARMKFEGPIKTNVYKNVQSPGTLWYHDHSMGVTSFNVRVGLHSFYLIRNKQVEKDLPSGQFQKTVLIYQNMIQSQPAYINCTTPCEQEHSQQCLQCLRRNDGNSFVRNEPLKRNSTYRFRILNADFVTRFANISFIFSNCLPTDLDQSLCSEVLPFSVIGTDSSLLRDPVHNVRSVDLASAERVDIVLTIEPKEKAYSSDSKLLITFSTGLLAQFNISSSIGQKKPLINKINVSFENITRVSNSQIVVKRMRPLVTTADRALGINGHVRFHQGKSQNPRIGTIQDWYFINTLLNGHPMHIHLIQYQVQEVVQLKRLNGNLCTYYLLDMVKNHAEYNLKNNGFIDQQMVRLSNNFTNLTGLCNYILAVTAPNYIKFFETFKNEDQVNSNRISGLNVEEPCKNRDQCLKYGQSINSTNQFKYINRTTDMSIWLKDYQRGWKQTFFVPPSSYAKLRIRWTRTDFPLTLTNSLYPDKNRRACYQGYFHIPEEQITRAPGYIYHCHILIHQDNQMMRPIMVQPSGCKNLKPWRERWQKEYCNQQALYKAGN